MARRQIKCIKKDYFEKITHVGGDWGWNGTREIITETEAINDITPPETNTYHVKVGTTDVIVIVAHRNGVPYLRTDPDYTTTDNLLSLPTC